MYFKLILIAENTRNKLNRFRICFKLVPVSNVAFFVSGSTLTLTGHFLHMFDNFLNAYLTLNTRISAK